MDGDGEGLDFDRRFGGIARLYGERVLEGFRHRTHLCVVGIGGVGSWTAEAFARSGVGRLTLIDLDHLAESNVNRQIHALEAHLGRSKVAVMAERIAGINPECEVICRDAFVDEGNLAELVPPGFDFVVDCIDAFRVKAALIAHCRRNRTRVLTVGGAGGQVDPQKLVTGDLSRTEHDPLLARTRKLLRKEYGFTANPRRRFDVPCVYSAEQPRYPAADGAACDRPPGGGIRGLGCAGYGSVVTVTASFGLFAAACVLNRLQRGFSA